MATVTMTEKKFQVSEKMNMEPINDYLDGKGLHNLFGPAMIWLGVACALALGVIIGDICVFVGLAMVAVGIVYNIIWKKNPKHGFRNPAPYDAAVRDFAERYGNTPEGKVTFIVNPGEKVVPASLLGYMPYERGFRYGYRGDFFRGTWCFNTRMVVYEDRLSIAQDDFYSNLVNERGIRRLSIEIPFSEIAFIGVQSYDVTTCDCTDAAAVSVNYLRIQSKQGENFDFPYTQNDDVNGLVALIGELMK